LEFEIKKIISALNFSEQNFIQIQKSARKFARRGLYAAVNIQVGERLTPNMIIPLRPTTGRAGFEPNEIDTILGKKARKKILAGQPIHKSYLH